MRADEAKCTKGEMEVDEQEIAVLRHKRVDDRQMKSMEN